VPVGLTVSSRLTALRADWHTVDPPRHPVLLINPRSGGGQAARMDLAARAHDGGIEPLVLGADGDLGKLVDAALERGADALGMAGGDGSLALVAARAAERDIPFVCIPAGTRNHFALDLGIDRHDPIGALDAFKTGMERRIDMAEVNGRPFVNNVSLGIYGEAVQEAGYRDAKLRTILKTMQEVLSSTASAPGLRVSDDRAHRHDSPLVVLVSNNPYALDEPLVQGSRPRLDTERLGIVVMDAPDARRHPLRQWTAPTLEVAASIPGTVPAGVDGEAVRLQPPLRFRTRPGALRVRISSEHPGFSPAALLAPR
jgi:diacylglycerol kinase family enzyme